MKATQTSKDHPFTIIIVFLFVVLLDAACFYLLFNSDAEINKILVIILGILFGLFTNIISYFASEKGIAYFLNIKKVNVSEVRHERRNALVVFCAAIIIIAIIQYPVANKRYKQYITNTSDYTKELNIWKESQNSVEFNNMTPIEQLNVMDNRPIYTSFSDGVPEIVEMISIFLPIATTIAAFILGFLSDKKPILNIFDKPIKKLNNEIISEESCKRKELEELKKEKDELLNKAQSEISELEIAGDFSGLEKVIRDKICKKDSTSYGKKVNKDFKDMLISRLPYMYESHIDLLYSALIERADAIHAQLSMKTEYPQELSEYKLEKIEEYKDDLKKISDKNTDFFTIKKEN